MALSNAKALADLSMPQYDVISTSKPENHDNQLPFNQEDQDRTGVKHKLNEDASPVTERSTNKPSPQISALPNSRNLFELLIKTVDCTTTTSEKQDVTIEQQGSNSMEEESVVKEGKLDTNSLEGVHLVNGAKAVVSNGMSPTDEESENQDVISSTDSENQQGPRGSSIQSTPPVTPGTADIVVNGDAHAAGQSLETQDDGSVFPFTRRLKWMSQRSREGSPSLPQQMANEQSNGSRYHGNAPKSNDVSEPGHVVMSRTSDLNSQMPGFQPSLGDSSRTSRSSPDSVLVNNGPSSLRNVTFVPVQIPKKDLCLALRPQTRLIDVSINFTEKSPTEPSRIFSSEPKHATSGSNREDGRSFSTENLQSFSRPSTQQNLLQSPQSQSFPNRWERSAVVTPHRPSLSASFISNSMTSAFSSPRSCHGNLVTKEAQSTKPIHLAGPTFQPRQEQHFHTSPHFHSTSRNIDKSSLFCGESFPKSPDQYSINDRVFRPVSPTWTHSLFTSSMSSVVSHSTKSTASDADPDEFSYACALHESANSPDIERIFGECSSPTERSSIGSTPPSSRESPHTTTTVVTSSTMSAFPFTDSEDARDSASFSDSSTTTALSSTLSTTTMENSIDKMDSKGYQVAKEHSPKQIDTKSNTKEDKKKRKLSLNVIHKRLEPKLPSPVRENQSSGDLYQDPSKLTREERALQRAMMRFSEMEMKEKVVPNFSEINAVEPKKTKESSITTEETISTSTWLLKVKRKKLLKKPSDQKPEVKTEHSGDGIDDVAEDEKKTKIKRKVLDDDIDHEKIAKKKKKFMNEEKKTSTKTETKNTDEEPIIVQDENLVKTVNDADILKKKKKEKAQKVKLKKEAEEKQLKKLETKRLKGDKLTSENCEASKQELPHPEMPTVERKKSADERHRVVSKTYMLVPSYQGFKDFQPVVMESRTRNKRAVQHVEHDTKPKLPLLVVESVNSKPVKEMIVAENEEVEKLVTECLRVQGKWHGDELEQVLKREEAELNEEVNRFRDAKKLSVNRTTGETILHKAARLGYHEIVRQCVLQGADANAKDNAGWTPLHEACARGKLAVVKVLARYGADVNSQSNDGIRPIHDAAEAGHVDVIRVLLSYGADPFLATYAGLNALACAKHPITKKYLQEYCLDIGHADPCVPLQEETNAWNFSCSSSVLDERPERISGILDNIPDCSEISFPEFEISDRPHLKTYNLPVFKDDVIVGRRNYLLLQELYQNGFVAKTTLQKKLKKTELREVPWSEFMEFLSENQVAVKPSFTPEGTSDVEPKAQLVPLNYTIRKLLGIRVETCRC